MDIHEERIFVDAYANAKKNAEYERHFSKAIELGHKIKDFLGPNSSLLSEYESFFNLAEAICLEEAYKMGFKDGRDLSQFLHR